MFKTPDPFVDPFIDVEQLCAESFVRHAEYFDALGSTNDRAAELARRPDLPTPVLVIARRQLAGRGRGNNAWWADDGALTFSLVLDTAPQGITPRDWPRLSLASAVGVCDALTHELAGGENVKGSGSGIQNQSLNPEPRTLNPIVGLKWPNDVFVDGGKVCGILIESPGGSAPAKDRLIVGIGINVNNSWQSAPSEADPSGTALCDVTGRQHDLRRVLLGVLAALEGRLAQLAAGDPQLPEAWQLLNLLNEKDVVVENNGQRVEGKCAGVADDGALMVDTPLGPQHFYSGTVRTS